MTAVERAQDTKDHEPRKDHIETCNIMTAEAVQLNVQVYCIALRGFLLLLASAGNIPAGSGE